MLCSVYGCMREGTSRETYFGGRVTLCESCFEKGLEPDSTLFRIIKRCNINVAQDLQTLMPATQIMMYDSLSVNGRES